MQSETKPFRILVVANEAVDRDTLREVLAEHSSDAEVLLVFPALNSRLRFWVSDVDPARRAAEARLRASLRGLGDSVQADGSIGDSDPIQAIEDGLRLFAADEIVLVTHADAQAHWVERDLIERARRAFDGHLIVHVVVPDGDLHVAA